MTSKGIQAKLLWELASLRAAEGKREMRNETHSARPLGLSVRSSRRCWGQAHLFKPSCSGSSVWLQSTPFRSCTRTILFSFPWVFSFSRVPVDDVRHCLSARRAAHAQLFRDFVGHSDVLLHSPHLTESLELTNICPKEALIRHRRKGGQFFKKMYIIL